MTPTNRLRALLAQDQLIPMPCCGDALGALLIEQAGFPLGFMSGFAAAAHRLGGPDTGLMSYAEVRRRLGFEAYDAAARRFGPGGEARCERSDDEPS